MKKYEVYTWNIHIRLYYMYIHYSYYVYHIHTFKAMDTYVRTQLHKSFYIELVCSSLVMIGEELGINEISMYM